MLVLLQFFGKIRSLTGREGAAAGFSKRKLGGNGGYRGSSMPCMALERNCMAVSPICSIGKDIVVSDGAEFCPRAMLSQPVTAICSGTNIFFFSDKR